MGCLGFLAWIAAEGFVLWKLGAWIGWATLVLVLMAKGILAGKLATVLAERRMAKAYQAMQQGGAVDEGLIGGVAIGIGALMFALPLPIANGIGVLLLLPPTRAIIAGMLRARLEAAIRKGGVQIGGFTMGSWSSGGGGGPASEGEVIDVEARPVERDEGEPPKLGPGK